MHDERSQRSDLTPVQKDRAVESAALAILVEHHPELLTASELVGEMTVDTERSGRREAVERAVAELVGAGLLSRRGALLVPTPAALRAAELEMGL